MPGSGEYSISDLAELFSVLRPTVTGRFPVDKNEQLDLMKITRSGYVLQQ